MASINVFPVHIAQDALNVLLSENTKIRNIDYNNIRHLFSMRSWSDDGFIHDLPLKLVEDVFKEVIHQRENGIQSVSIIKAAIESRFSNAQVLPPEYYTKLETFMFREVSDNTIDELREVIVNYIETGVIYKDLPNIKDMIAKIELSDLGDLTSLINEFKSSLQTATKSLQSVKRANNLENVILNPQGIADLTLAIHQELNRPNRILKTNIRAFDHMWGGGLTPGESVLIGASTGSFKSGTLLNLTESIAIGNKVSDYKTQDPTKKPVIVYVSFENVQRMSYLRLCKLITNKNQEEFKASDPELIRREVETALSDAMAIKLVYAPSYSVSVNELDRFCMGIVDDVGQEYETVAVIVDYLALFKQADAENHRLGLSMTQRNLSDYATLNNIATLTAVQLNGLADEAPKLTRQHISDAKAIIDHVDNCTFFRRHDVDPNQESLSSSYDYTSSGVEKYAFLEAYAVKARSAEDSPDQRIIIPFMDGNSFRLARLGEKNFYDESQRSRDFVDEHLNKKFKIMTAKVDSSGSDDRPNVPAAVLPPVVEEANPYE